MFNKATFDHYCENYGDYLQAENPPLPYWYQAQQVFQENWNPSRLDTKSMLDDAIDESTENWSLKLNEAKRVVLAFSEKNSDLLLTTFKDLFDEGKSLDGRIDRFIFHQDLLLSELNGKKMIFPDHHHNREIVSIYLTFRHPDLYLPFDFPLFQEAMRKMKAMQVPFVHEIDRYYKITRIMTKFLSQNQDINDFYETHGIYTLNQLISYDFMLFIKTINKR